MRHRKHPKKEKGQRIHFKRRLYERYGITANRQSIEDMSNLIRNGESVIERKSTNRISVHRITFQGKEVRVAYDKGRGQVVSALPNWGYF